MVTEPFPSFEPFLITLSRDLRSVMTRIEEYVAMVTAFGYCLT